MLWQLLQGGLLALKEYIALHVLTCLVPAFLLAGAMVTFISRETILRFLGSGTRKIISFPLAAISSIFLSVCSCTVIPIAAGLYFQGGGIGPAFILLWVAPAANILALVYTGAILGMDMAGWRLISALLTASIVGLVMVWTFREEEKTRITNNPALMDETLRNMKVMSRKDLGLILLLVVTLLAPNYLVQKGPYSAKVIVFLVFSLITAVYALKVKTGDEIMEWLRESWWFVKIIFPLLLVGVFIVGIIGALLKRGWIETWLGGAGLRSSFLATIIGAVTYFATLTEAPFVDTLMKLGMGKGPALSLLLAGPGLSLPNMLAVGKIFGWKKTAVYVGTIVVLATMVGLILGNFVF